jgi:hypothetical protein
MKRLASVFVILLVLVFNSHCELDIFGTDKDDNRSHADSTYILSFGLTGVTSFSPRTSNGSIELQGTTTDSIRVEVRYRVYAGTESAAREGLGLITVDSTLALTGELGLWSEHPTEDSRDFQVSYVIALPADLPVDATTLNGAIDAEDMTSSLDVRSTNGTISVEDHQGQLLALTVNGGIDLENIDGSISAQTTNGSVEAENVLVGTNSVLIGTSNGSVELTIPANTSAALSAQCANGTVSITGLSVIYTVNQANRKVGVIGDGDGVITLTAGNGNIAVRGL